MSEKSVANQDKYGKKDEAYRRSRQKGARNSIPANSSAVRPSAKRSKPKSGFEFNVEIAGYYNIGSRVDSSELIISVNGSIHWNTFLIISAYIKNEILKVKIKKITINLAHVITATQNGILPLIALLESYRVIDYKIQVILPKSHEIRATFNNHNWSHYLDKQHPLNRRSFPRSTGIMEFVDFSALNDAINKAVRVALKGQVFEDGALKSLEWSLNEITDNVVRHSGNSKGWFEVTWRADSELTFTVADNGIGIPTTMKKAFPELEDDASAIHRAIEKGVTSSQEGQGNGLAGSIEIVNQALGKLMINSHGGHLRALNGRVKAERACIPYMGTFVEFSIPGDKAIDLDKAIWGFETISHVQFSYEEEDSANLYIRLRDEESNFGNRPTGLKIRNLITNMMSECPEKRITIDFDEINLISSSFADEVFGKLAANLGVLNFSRVFILKNTTNLVASLIDRAIAQRMAQNYAQLSGLSLVEEVKDF